MKVEVTVAATVLIDVNPDDYDTKEEMLESAEKDAMLNLDRLDNYRVIDSQINPFYD